MHRMLQGAGRTRLIAALVISIATLFASTGAEAQRRHLYAGLGGGPYDYFDCCRIHGRLVGEFGIHFSNDDRGFFLAFEAATTFGDDYFLFLTGVRLGGDIEIWGRRDYGIMLRPSGLIGFAWHDFNGPSNDFGAVVLQPAFDFRFVFAERLIALWVRPVAFDLLFYWDRRDPFHDRDWYFAAGYQFLLGIDFQFG